MSSSLLSAGVSSACSRLRRAIVARRKPQRERRAASDLALDGDRAVELLDDALGDRQAEAEAAALGRDEVVEDRRQPIGGMPEPVSVDADLDLIAGARGRDGRRGRPAAVAWIALVIRLR